MVGGGRRSSPHVISLRSWLFRSKWALGCLVRSIGTLRLPKMSSGQVVLRLFSMSDRDKDTEISALRHQLAVLQRQLGDERARFTPADRAFLAALLRRLPGEAFCRLRLLVRPETILRRRRALIARRHAARSTPKRLGRLTALPSRGGTRLKPLVLIFQLSQEGMIDQGLQPCSTWVTPTSPQV